MIRVETIGTVRVNRARNQHVTGHTQTGCGAAGQITETVFIVVDDVIVERKILHRHVADIEQPSVRPTDTIENGVVLEGYAVTRKEVTYPTT